MQQNGYLRFIYNSNPFYLISAGIILYGIQSTLGQSNDSECFWLIAAILAGYTCLMAATAICIVKYGEVWDDARSILLILLLFFFAISISFDELCLTRPGLGISMLTSGFIFSVVIIETVIRCLRILFPKEFQIPLYLSLFLIFMYPLAFSFKETWMPTLDQYWLMLLYPCCSAVVTLTLIPAIRKGRQLVEKNGTPWNWPLFPYSVFAMLLFGMSFRAAFICISFEPEFGLESVFGTYFLVPIALAVSILLLEAAVAEKNKTFRFAALYFPIAVIPLAWTWPQGSIYLEHLSKLSDVIAPPIWISSCALVAYYFWAWIRNVDSHAIGFNVSCVLLSTASISVNQVDFANWQPWPILMLAVFYISQGIVYRKAQPYAAATFCLAISTYLFAGQLGSRIVAIEISLLTLITGWLVVGAAANCKFARQLGALNSLLIGLVGVTTAIAGILNSAPPWIVDSNLAFLAVVALTSHLIRPDRLIRYSGQFCIFLLAGCLVFQSANIASSDDMRKLANFVLLAICFFIVGAFISLLKVGLGEIIRRGLRLHWEDLASRFTTYPDKPVPGFSDLKQHLYD